MYTLLGKATSAAVAATDVPPPLGQPVLEGSVGYHCREGGHSTTDYDWGCFIDFADRHLKPT